MIKESYSIQILFEDLKEEALERAYQSWRVSHSEEIAKMKNEAEIRFAFFNDMRKNFPARASY